MYGLSREASAVRKDSNNECRGVSRGRSSRPRDGQGEGPNRALSHKTICVFGNRSSQMSEEELSFSLQNHINLLFIQHFPCRYAFISKNIA